MNKGRLQSPGAAARGDLFSGNSDRALSASVVGFSDHGDIRNVEILNLDGLPDAEALQLALPAAR